MDNPQIKALEAELAALKADREKREAKSKPRGRYELGPHHAHNLLPEHEEAANKGAAWTAKVAAKGIASPLNIPTLLGNAVQWARGKEGFDYPTEKVGKKIDELTKGESIAPKDSWQEETEPYIEGLIGLGTTGGVGKGLELAGKVIPKVGGAIQKTGNFLQKGTSLNPAKISGAKNVASTMGGIYGGNKATENYDNPIAGVAGSIAGAILGRGAVSAAHASRRIPQGLGHFRAKAALRHKPIVGEYLKESAHELGGKQALAQEEGLSGSIARKATEDYKYKADRVFGNLEQRMVKNAGDMKVDIEKPLDFVFRLFGDLTDPVLRNEFMKSSVGLETKRILGLPLSLNADQFVESLEKLPKLFSKDFSFKDAWRYRKNIDNSLSKKAWNQIGNIDEGELRNFRMALSDSIGDAFERKGTQPSRQWNRFRKNYEKYGDTKIEKINDILESKYEPSKNYEAAKKEFGKEHSHSNFVLGNIKNPNQKERYALNLIQDIGKDADEFDTVKFFRGFHNLDKKSQGAILGSLSPEMKRNFTQQLDVVKGITNIAGGEKGLNDIVYRTPALSVLSAAKKAGTKTLAGWGYKTPEGRERLTRTAIKFSKREPEVMTKSEPRPRFYRNELMTFARNQSPVATRSTLQNLMSEAQNLGIDVDSLLGG